MTCYVAGCQNPMDEAPFGLCRQHLEVLLFAASVPLEERAAAVQAVRQAVKAYGRQLRRQKKAAAAA